MTVKSWREHLAAPGVPYVHFAGAADCDVEALTRAVSDLGFATFRIDGFRVRSKDDLLHELAAAVGFPAYFGNNWDAASDLLRDLSWISAKGYLLIITASDNLLRIGIPQVLSFIHVAERAIQDWRDERGEYGQRTAPIAFHLVLYGANVLKAELRNELTEAICEHSS